MESSHTLTDAVAMSPTDLAMLRRALDSILPAGSTPTEREFRAATLVNLFKGGVRTEGELVTVLTGGEEPRG